MARLSWGVDAFGNRYHLCDDCGKYLGKNIYKGEENHQCKTRSPEDRVQCRQVPEFASSAQLTFEFNA